MGAQSHANLRKQKETTCKLRPDFNKLNDLMNRNEVANTIEIYFITISRTGLTPERSLANVFCGYTSHDNRKTEI